MLKMINRKLRNQKGFTLVELMVVVVILGILVAIAVPVYNSAQARAQTSTCLANQRIIDSAVMQFCIDNNGTYPANLAALVPTYIQVTPECPDGGTYTIPTAAGEQTTCSIAAHARP